VGGAGRGHRTRRLRGRPWRRGGANSGARMSSSAIRAGCDPNPIVDMPDLVASRPHDQDHQDACYVGPRPRNDHLSENSRRAAQALRSYTPQAPPQEVPPVAGRASGVHGGQDPRADRAQKAPAGDASVDVPAIDAPMPPMPPIGIDCQTPTLPRRRSGAQRRGGRWQRSRAPPRRSRLDIDVPAIRVWGDEDRRIGRFESGQGTLRHPRGIADLCKFRGPSKLRV